MLVFTVKLLAQLFLFFSVIHVVTHMTTVRALYFDILECRQDDECKVNVDKLSPAIAFVQEMVYTSGQNLLETVNFAVYVGKALLQYAMVFVKSFVSKGNGI